VDETIDSEMKLYTWLSINKGVPFWVHFLALVAEANVSSAILEQVQKTLYPFILSGEVYKVESEKLICLI
jgi:hypothetical protein